MKATKQKTENIKAENPEVDNTWFITSGQAENMRRKVRELFKSPPVYTSGIFY